MSWLADFENGRHKEDSRRVYFQLGCLGEVKGNSFIKRLTEFAGQACKVVKKELNKLLEINEIYLSFI